MFALFVDVGAWFLCKGNLYNYEEHACVTAAECRSINSNLRAYKAVGYCISPKIDGFIKPSEQKDGSYECKEGFYLKFYDSKATCVKSKDECDGLYML